jgi:hypothetical protein
MIRKYRPNYTANKAMQQRMQYELMGIILHTNSPPPPPPPPFKKKKKKQKKNNTNKTKKKKKTQIDEQKVNNLNSLHTFASVIRRHLT